MRAARDGLRRKLADRDATVRDLEQLQELALSRLAAQRGEITRLRRRPAAAMAPPHRPPSPGGAAARQETR